MGTLFVLNEKAGSFASRGDAVLRACDAWPDAEIARGTSEEELPLVVRHALQRGFDTFVAGGGDGTLHATVNALTKNVGHEGLAKVRVGLVPMGTGNDFARTLGIDPDPEAAFAQLREATETRIDLIEVRAADKPVSICVNLASGGLGGKIEEEVDSEDKARWGAFAYLRGAVAAARQTYDVTLELDGAVEKVRAVSVIVANGRAAGGGYEVAPHAHPQDRRLDVVVVEESSLLDLGAIAMRLFAGDYTAHDNVRIWRVRELHVSAEPLMPFSVDGCWFSEKPTRFRVLPGALRMLVPQPRRP